MIAIGLGLTHFLQRTSSGPKLGKSIAGDLEKRADKKQREALKTSSTRQAIRSAVRGGKKSRDKRSDEDKENDVGGGKQDMHKLDIKIPGKALTDEGLALVCEGLAKALASCHDLALIDFNVSDNALTTRSLARLAPVICASKFNLQTLDLSHNSFQVTTAQEAHDWEIFLSSFRNCMTLRRLDLSDNPSLGPWAFEILARVYSREPLVAPLPATGNQSLITLPDDEGLDDTSSLAASEVHASPYEHSNDLPRCANGKTLADTWILGYRRGLRSLPYLTLSNVGLTDTGALFLSYVIEQHHFPTQLITEINAIEATSQIRTYRQDANTKGLDWDNNTQTLGKDGLHLLQCAEKQRVRNVLGDADSTTSSAYEIVRPGDYQDFGNTKQVPCFPIRSTMANPFPAARTYNRRFSIRSVHSVEYSMYDKSDIDSARKKIQRNTILQSGCSSVELWRAAVKAISVSRLVFLVAPEPGIMSVEENPRACNGSDADMSASIGSFASYDDLRNSMHSLTLKHSLSPIEENKRRSYAATLMTTAPRNLDESFLAITDVTNVSAVPKVQSNGKALSTMHMESPTLAEQHGQPNTKTADQADNFFTLNDSTEREDSSSPYIKHQMSRMEKLQDVQGGHSDGYRDLSNRSHLPLNLGVKILSYAMDSHDLSILSEGQRRSAFEWGQKRKTLSEVEWRRKDESSQLLILLAHAQCVDY